ncbi:MAG: hypothetical protein IBX71_11410 [Candidatus Desulforudis sp.]|nr:hypothetical protein [Desulforudis sp.]
MEFEAAIGSWQDGYISVSITLEKTRVAYTNFRKRRSCFPRYQQDGKWVLVRDLTGQDERERVKEFFEWIYDNMKVARELYPSEPRFARDSAIPGVNWAFILWTDEEIYSTRGRSGSPAWWDDACALISGIVDVDLGAHTT